MREIIVQNRDNDSRLEELQVSQTKKCPFCAEVIQARAIKCRYCGEFLNTEKSKTDGECGDGQCGEDLESNILFKGKPSIFGLSGTFFKCGVVFAIGVLLLTFQFEKKEWFDFNRMQRMAGGEDSPGAERHFDKEQAIQHQIVFYRRTGGWILCGLATLVFAMKLLRIKMTAYEVTSDRIEWSRGILDRKIDNLDMFRVVDVKLRRSLWDCVFGIGTVELITSDKTDPKFMFKKVRNSRKLYDIIKKTSLDADKQRGVVHLE